MSHFPIPKLTDLDIAFPAKMDWLPGTTEVPEKWHRGGLTKKHRFFAAIFYHGIAEMDLLPRDGVDPALAMRALKQLLGTYAIPHERKESCFAFLCDQWYADIRWRPANGAVTPFEDPELERRFVLLKTETKPR